MSRYRPSMPPVVPYSGPLEPNEPDEPNSTAAKVDSFLNSIKQYEDTGRVPFKSAEYKSPDYRDDSYPSVPFKGMMGQPEEPERRSMNFRPVGFKEEITSKRL